MPDQLFTYYVENALVIISINSGIWGVVMIIRLHIDILVISKGATKQVGNKGGGWEKRYKVCYVLYPVCVLSYISTVILEVVRGIAGGQWCVCLV
jgi:hypothetical protein